MNFGPRILFSFFSHLTEKKNTKIRTYRPDDLLSGCKNQLSKRKPVKSKMALDSKAILQLGNVHTFGTQNYQFSIDSLSFSEFIKF